MIIVPYSADTIIYLTAKLNLGLLSDDPDTSGWGTGEEGKSWYNTTDHHFKVWNGSEITIL